jgi:hypothetical protein
MRKAYAEVMKRPVERVGILVIRVWVEKNSVSGLRARITRTVDIATHDEVVTAAATVDEICAEVRSWLHEFHTTSPRRPQGGTGDSHLR